MKKGFQWMALLAVALLGACSSGKNKVAADQAVEMYHIVPPLITCITISLQ